MSGVNHIIDAIIETVREPFLVLTADFIILKANPAFYDTFQLTPEETLDHLIYEAGNRRWDIPELRTLIEQIHTGDGKRVDYDLDHVFSGNGHKIIRLNARRIDREDINAPLILLAMEDLTERRRLAEEIREISLKDQLTDVYNRHGFLAFAEQHFLAAKRTKRQLMLAFVDVDDMQWINDTLGHEEGDKTLVDTADILRQTFRESDIIGRIGSDEFAVLSNEITGVAPQVIGDRLRRCLEAYNQQGNNRRKLSLSVGMALYDPEKPSSLDEMMAKADHLMNARKKMKSKP